MRPPTVSPPSPGRAPLPVVAATTCTVLLLTLALAAAAPEPHAAAPAKETARANIAAAGPEEMEQGRRRFETHCAPCHGPKGEGAKGPTLALPSLPRATDDAALLKIIAEGIGNTEMPAARLEPHEIRLVAAFMKSLGQLPAEEVRGDPSRGAQLYLRAACATCHSWRGHGGALGPDLSDIGRRRSAAYLRRALAEPSAEVPQSFTAYRGDGMAPENFLFVRLTTRQGETVAGVRVNEDTFSLQLRDLTGKVHSFFKADLGNVQKDWGYSPMPAYAGILTPDELDDLVAWLVTLRGQK